MNEHHGILLCSGGMDSTTLAYWLDQQGITFLACLLAIWTTLR